MRRMNLMTVGVVLACVGAAGAARADEVTHWVDVLNQAIRVNGGPPCPIARAVAMTQIAVFDAVNSIDRGHRPFLQFVPAPFNASMEAAAAQLGIAQRQSEDYLKGVNDVLLKVHESFSENVERTLREGNRQFQLKLTILS